MADLTENLVTLCDMKRLVTCHNVTNEEAKSLKTKRNSCDMNICDIGQCHKNYQYKSSTYACDIVTPPTGVTPLGAMSHPALQQEQTCLN